MYRKYYWYRLFYFFIILFIKRPFLVSLQLRKSCTYCVPLPTYLQVRVDGQRARVAGSTFSSLRD